MSDITTLLKKSCEDKASDIFIVAGRPVSYKVHHQLIELNDTKLSPAQTQNVIEQIYELAHRSMDSLLDTGDDDFSYSLPGVSRFRVNCYRQRGSLAAVIRIITFDLPDPAKLHIPQEIIHLADINKGMVLVTGPAGSGKTTTLACMVDYINRHFEKHIITLEDPIEYLHSHKQSIVSQREIGIDTANYVTALRASLRQMPDVILLGEMRDTQTISVSMTLKAVVSQQLVPTIDGGMTPVFEVMIMTPAIRNLIRENKIAQIDAAIAQGSQDHMISMDQSLFHLYQQGIIDKKTCIYYATNPELMKRRIN